MKLGIKNVIMCEKKGSAGVFALPSDKMVTL